ncbi:FGGY-family carbohydrate kinase [Nitrobacter sp.]|uniref:FGGY-family carbohydrate kinase n=1 Tax=Nitrobacter sp. TaxID=29420 RepID=UPI0029CAB8A4|nr:FGGY-family carbohydrate kinase [Nitrobacter sp.]
MRDLVIAVDVGSSSARAGVFDKRGVLLARAEAPFSTAHPLPDHAEHSSDEIWTAVCQAVREAVATGRIAAGEVKGIAFDATCSLVALDRAGRPVTVSVTGEDRWNVIMWADHRATAEAEEITATRHRVLDHVGNVMSPEMEIPKLLWLKRHCPDAWSRYGLVLDLTDFLTWKATGRAAVSTCTVTCKWTYLAHEKPGWQSDFLSRIGLDDLPDRASLPASTQSIGTSASPLTAQSAAELGLPRDCIVGVGAIDAHAGGIGVLGGLDAAALNETLAMIAGTSSCHMAASPDPRQIPGIWGPYYDAMLPGYWLNEGGQSATGSLLDHILNLHTEGQSLGADRHAVMAARIEAARAESGLAFVEGLHVLPDFHGNRSPLADPDSVGVIHGLRLDASADSLTRLYFATAIGIALGTRHIIDALNDAGYAIDQIRLTGGHAASPLLVQLYADAAGVSVSLPEQPDGVLSGTACAAAAGCGLYPSLTAAAAEMTRIGRTVQPVPSVRDFFDRRYRAFLLMHEQRQALSRLA